MTYIKLISAHLNQYLPQKQYVTRFNFILFIYSINQSHEQQKKQTNKRVPKYLYITYNECNMNECKKHNNNKKQRSK